MGLYSAVHADGGYIVEHILKGTIWQSACAIECSFFSSVPMNNEFQSQHFIDSILFIQQPCQHLQNM
jgi:hypothetical protein